MSKVNAEVTIGLKDFSIGPIEYLGVPILGRISINTNATGNVKYEILPNKYIIRVSVKFHCIIDCSVNFSKEFNYSDLNGWSDFNKLPEKIKQYIIDNAAEIFKELCKDFLKYGQFVIDGIIIVGEEIGKALCSVYEQTKEAAAKYLKSIGKVASEIADALIDGYDATAKEVAGALQSIGETAAVVAGILKDFFNTAAETAESILKGIGYVSDEVGAFEDIFSCLPMDATINIWDPNTKMTSKIKLSQLMLGDFVESVDDDTGKKVYT